MQPWKAQYSWIWRLQANFGKLASMKCIIWTVSFMNVARFISTIKFTFPKHSIIVWESSSKFLICRCYCVWHAWMKPVYNFKRSHSKHTSSSISPNKLQRRCLTIAIEPFLLTFLFDLSSLSAELRIPWLQNYNWCHVVKNINKQTFLKMKHKSI